MGEKVMGRGRVDGDLFLASGYGDVKLAIA